MINIKEELREAFILDEDLLYEMANISHEDTGLSADIWADSEGKERNVSHRDSPRVKIKKNRKMIPITIEEHPKVVAHTMSKKQKEKVYRNYKDVFTFVGKYYKIFLKHYNKEINDRQLFKELEDEGAFKN